MKGAVFALNGKEIRPAPDETVWTPVVEGDALSGSEKRSPFWVVEWRFRVAGPCHMNVWDYDNTTLSSFVSPPPEEIDQHFEYSEAYCKSVTMRHRRSIASELVMRFLVNLESIVT